MPYGYGRLGPVRGTLEGTPLNDQFPIAKNVEKIVGQNEGQVFGKNAYAMEGWCLCNRGWEATVTNTGIFVGKYIVPKMGKGSELKVHMLIDADQSVGRSNWEIC